MNKHAPKKPKFVSWEFRGKPFKRNGYTWLRAKHRTTNWSWFYCFELDEIFDTAQ